MSDRLRVVVIEAEGATAQSAIHAAVSLLAPNQAQVVALPGAPAPAALLLAEPAEEPRRRKARRPTPHPAQGIRMAPKA